jgi:hypothetical protein
MKLHSGKDQLSIFHPSVETISGCSLSDERDVLMNNGYCRFDKFITPKTVELLLNEIQDLTEKALPSSTYGVYRNPHNSILVMNRVDKESDFLYDFVRHQRLIEIASALLGKAAMPLHVEYFSKPTENSSASPPHQDHIFYQEHFDDELAISFWIALDDVGEKSGALQYASPTTKVLLPHKPSAAIDFDFELEDASNFSFQSVPVACGGCIVHHSYAVHRSLQNESKQPRRAIVFNYRGSPYRTWLQSENPNENETE